MQKNVILEEGAIRIDGARDQLEVPFVGNEPTRAHEHDAGLDLRASEDVHLPVGTFRAVGTGTAVHIPEGHVGLVFGRSGLGFKHGVAPVNAVGVIDSGYIGEIKVALINHGAKPFRVESGMRIAQLVILPIADVAMVRYASLDETARGAAGFGSTGVE